jgi:hypothetical protein
MAKTLWFGKDAWLYNDPLCLLFPILFKLCDQQNIFVHQFISDARPVTFCRWLTDDLSLEWNKIVEDASTIMLDTTQDVVSWKLENSGRFSVKSTYNALTSSDGGSTFKYI